MVLVALASLAIGLEAGRRRRAEWLRRSGEHLRLEVSAMIRRDLYDRSAENLSGQISHGREKAATAPDARRRANWAESAAQLVRAREEASAMAVRWAACKEYHAQMKEKWHRAASWPWASIEPDPAGPPTPPFCLPPRPIPREVSPGDGDWGAIPPINPREDAP